MLDGNISRYIWRHTRVQQLWILTIVALSMIPYFMAFSLPKSIVNGPIQGAGFETPDATQVFARLVLPWPGGGLVLFDGIALERLNMLFALSAVFLALVIINGLFKYYINTYKGKLGERLLRRLRFTLVDNVLRFPPQAFKRLKGAEVASMVKDEVEPLGGFAGDAFVTPALLGGQALTALLFIFLQSVPLGLITTALVGVQVFIIPRMRRRLLVLGRERQLTARQLAGRVSEIVDGIGTIHAYDTSNYERADIAARLGRIFKIRFDIYQWKFLVKFINNFLSQLTPFLFYSVGGYLALSGRLDIGQLVAVIGAYKDLPGPLKELIDWDQNRQDVQVKYQQVILQFAVDGMLAPDIQRLAAQPPARLDSPLATVNLKVVDDGGGISLERVNFAVAPGEAVAVVGAAGSGSDTLAEALARQVWPSGGKVTAGQANLLLLPEAVTGRSITYAGPDSFFFSGSVLDNLLYGLKNAPHPDTISADAMSPERRWQQSEARMSGNPDFDPQTGWIDHAALGLQDHAALMDRVLQVLDCVQLRQDMQDLALRSCVRQADYPDLAAQLVALRGRLRTALQDRDLSGLIVPFEPGAYNPEATVFENLLFGHANRSDLHAATIGTNPHFRKLLQDQGLATLFDQIGVDIARNVIGLFADLPPDHPFFRQLSFMSQDDIPVYQLLLQKYDTQAAVVSDDDRAMMIRLTFEYIEPRYRFGLLNSDIMARIVAFRLAFHETMPDDMRAGIEMYDPARFMESGTLLDNVLFGRISQKFRDGADQVREALTELLHQEGLYDDIIAIGLTFDVGSGGKRINAAQRQKLGLARAIIRQSDYYVLNRPLSALDARSQDRILLAILTRLRAQNAPPAIVWVVSTPAAAQHFDRVVVFSAGNLVENDAPDVLLTKNGIFKDLLTA